VIDDIRLPVDVERGAEGGPGFKTTVTTLANGAEQRNQEWSAMRGQWNVGYGLQSLTSLQAVYEFFIGRRGRARGFRFKDWADYTATEQPVGTVTGNDLRRQLQKVYGDAENPYNRVIILPVAGTLTVYVDTLATEAYTLLDNGVLEFPSDPGPNVLATFEFDVPVRFDIDDLKVQLANYNAGQIPNIPVVELKQG
jgi:uncharacterized protein (TIGR02217 family)